MVELVSVPVVVVDVVVEVVSVPVVVVEVVSASNSQLHCCPEDGDYRLRKGS